MRYCGLTAETYDAKAKSSAIRISVRKADNMSKAHAKTRSVTRIKVSDETRRAYADRDKSLGHADPDAPVMPPEFWEGAQIGDGVNNQPSGAGRRVNLARLIVMCDAGGATMLRGPGCTHRSAFSFRHL
jgi:hypothetical protein